MNDFPRRTFHVNVVQLLLVFAGADADVADVHVADVDVADADVVPKLDGRIFPGLPNLEGTNQCFQVCPTSKVQINVSRFAPHLGFGLGPIPAPLNLRMDLVRILRQNKAQCFNV